MGQETATLERTPASCQLVPFKKAVIVSSVHGAPLLVVSGIAPSTRMDIFLSHREYRDKPDWWGIEVVGALPGGVCLTETRRFEAAIPISHLVGHKGIEVIGADTSVKLTL